MSERAVAVERAAAFLDESGDGLLRAACAAIVGKGSVKLVLARMPSAAECADADALVTPLGLCADLGALHATFVQDAAARLAMWQQPDGGFGEGDLSRRLALSGMLGGFLGRSPFVRPDALAATGDFLSTHWNPDLVQGGNWSHIAGYAHFFANAPHEAGDEILQWCGRELERGFRTRVFGSVETARVLALCDAHAVPGATLPIDELLVGLITEQGDDGGFFVTGIDRARATFWAILSLVRLAGITS